MRRSYDAYSSKRYSIRSRGANLHVNLSEILRRIEHLDSQAVGSILNSASLCDKCESGTYSHGSHATRVIIVQLTDPTTRLHHVAPWIVTVQKDTWPRLRCDPRLVHHPCQQRQNFTHWSNALCSLVITALVVSIFRAALQICGAQEEWMQQCLCLPDITPLAAQTRYIVLDRDRARGHIL